VAWADRGGKRKAGGAVWGGGTWAAGGRFRGRGRDGRRKLKEVTELWRMYLDPVGNAGPWLIDTGGLTSGPTGGRRTRRNTAGHARDLSRRQAYSLSCPTLGLSGPALAPGPQERAVRHEQSVSA